MKKLTQETGGRVIEVGDRFDKLKEAFDQIARELRSQYNIGYTPTNTAHDGTFRKIEIRSKNGYKIQSRSDCCAAATDRVGRGRPRPSPLTLTAARRRQCLRIPMRVAELSHDQRTNNCLLSSVHNVQGALLFSSLEKNDPPFNDTGSE